jgi:type I restriction enzyme M protein
LEGVHCKLGDDSVKEIAEYIILKSPIADKNVIHTFYNDVTKTFSQIGARKRGQYFTPHNLAYMMAICLNIQPGKTIYDPACGKGELLCAAHEYVAKRNTSCDERLLHGCEIDDLNYRLLYLYALLNDIHVSNASIVRGDTLLRKDNKTYDYIVANIPFGKHKKTEDNSGLLEIDFLDHIINSTRKESKAAVIVPDTLLFSNGHYARIRKRLLNETNLHTILRLPTNMFAPMYNKTSILFFDGNHPTENLITYTMRKGKKENPSLPAYYLPFVRTFKKNRVETLKEAYKNRFAKVLTREEIRKRDDEDIYPLFDDFTKKEEDDGPTLTSFVKNKLETLVLMIQKALGKFKD